MATKYHYEMWIMTLPDDNSILYLSRINKLSIYFAFLPRRCVRYEVQYFKNRLHNAPKGRDGRQSIIPKLQHRGKKKVNKQKGKIFSSLFAHSTDCTVVIIPRCIKFHPSLLYFSYISCSVAAANSKPCFDFEVTASCMASMETFIFDLQIFKWSLNLKQQLKIHNFHVLHFHCHYNFSYFSDHRPGLDFKVSLWKEQQ